MLSFNREDVGLKQQLRLQLFSALPVGLISCLLSGSAVFYVETS